MAHQAQEPDQSDFIGQFCEVMKKQVELYTLGESGSVPNDVAYSLMESVLYACGIDLAHADGQKLNRVTCQGVAVAHAAGIERMEKLVPDARRLLRQAALRFVPRGESRACDGTEGIDALLADIALDSVGESLKEIDAFLKSYDPRFFCAETPLFLEYKLDEPVSDALRGVDYVYAYLSRLLEES